MQRIPRMHCLICVSLGDVGWTVYRFCHSRWRPHSNQSLQLLVFLLRFNQHWNIVIGIFPEREEVLIDLARGGRIALQDGGAG